jgi:hypothetical protein
MPEVEKISIDIMKTYISSLGVSSQVLFTKPGKEHGVTQNFEETWSRIVKTVSGQTPESDRH